MFIALKLMTLMSISFPTTIANYGIPIVKWLYTATYLTMEISRMMLNVLIIWFWQIASEVALIDAFALVVAIVISTKVLLDIFSYEIVITWNNPVVEYEQQVDLA
ncbi:unnamed protein product [Caenorhabditis sp. 36 PRJEB53466]|nr:unnamed protein product [Caenorhabditis sp. 36 PRJEB53466]